MFEDTAFFLPQAFGPPDEYPGTTCEATNLFVNFGCFDHPGRIAGRGPAEDFDVIAYFKGFWPRDSAQKLRFPSNQCASTWVLHLPLPVKAISRDLSVFFCVSALERTRPKCHDWSASCTGARCGQDMSLGPYAQQASSPGRCSHPSPFGVLRSVIARHDVPTETDGSKYRNIRNIWLILPFSEVRNCKKVLHHWFCHVLNKMLDILGPPEV